MRMRRLLGLPLAGGARGRSQCPGGLKDGFSNVPRLAAQSFLLHKYDPLAAASVSRGDDKEHTCIPKHPQRREVGGRPATVTPGPANRT